MNNFNEISKKTTNKFIQSIVFIDDRAYESNNSTNQHDFDAKKITNAFSNDGKICAVYQPIAESELSSLIKVSKKSDVTVLDWQMNLERESITTENKNENNEEDDNENDSRGIFTKKIIHELLSDNELKNSLKLILIYTGEVDLQEIASSIYEDIDNKDSFKIDDNDLCSILSDSCKIMVISKSNSESTSSRGKHLPVLSEKTINYEELPEFITNEFTKLTSGLLSNFAMESLAEIRCNFNHIVSLFSKNLDSAYLAHQSLLPNTSDANELLVELLGNTFTSIIRYKNLNSFLDETIINSWIENNKNKLERIHKLKKSDGSDDTVEIKITIEKLKSLLKTNPEISSKFMESIGKDTNNNGIGSKKIENLISKYVISLFTENSDYEEINYQFANLCQHRNIIKNPEYIPSLSLGTIVKSTDTNKFYICIQQRCDSVRLKDDETRRFLFLSLQEITTSSSEDYFDFLTPNGVKLRVDKGTYALRTVKFKGSDGTVLACRNSNELYFYPSHYSEELVPEKFLFIVELQDMYSQQIIENYSTSLSRIGLDEPEWIRRLRPKN